MSMFIINVLDYSYRDRGQIIGPFERQAEAIAFANAHVELMSDGMHWYVSEMIPPDAGNPDIKFRYA